VGAVCRAVKNMGGGDLVTVGGSYDHEQARRMAVHAAEVLESCERTETLEQALGGCGRVIGTTAHGEALLAIGFLSEDNPVHMMATIRALLGRSVPDRREVNVLRGLARQILWFAGEGRTVAAGKRERGEKLR